MLRVREQASCHRPPARIHPPTGLESTFRVGVYRSTSEQQSDPDSRNIFGSERHPVPPASSSCSSVYGSRDLLTSEADSSSSPNGPQPTSSAKLRIKSNAPPTPCTQLRRAPEDVKSAATGELSERRDNEHSDESTNNSETTICGRQPSWAGCPPLRSHAQHEFKKTAQGLRPQNKSCPKITMEDRYVVEPQIELQPEFSPISQEQLAAEVKGIYAGLVMVEAKCINIDTQKASHPEEKLSTEQWQALVALHRTLLYEHHDFLMATQHPSANPALLGLATKYSMPARMWKHGIHAFSEVLRHRRPESQEYMLAFIYLAYRMMSLLLETAPGFTDTWIECLGDLARYRMAIEEERETHTIWGGIASRWYEMAANRHPLVDRLYHHSRNLERPSLRKFYLYSRALKSVVPSSSGIRPWGTLCSSGMCFPHDRPLFHDTALPKSLGTTSGGSDDRSEGQQKKKDPDEQTVHFEKRHFAWMRLSLDKGKEEAMDRRDLLPTKEKSKEWLEDLEPAARLSLSRVSPWFLFDIPDNIERLVQLVLDWLACRQQRPFLRLRQRVSVLRLSAALYIADATPRACAAPISGGPANVIEAGLQTSWQITLTLTPLVIVVGGVCRVVWILAKHERPLKHPIWSGAMSLIVSTVWGVVRTAESAFTKEQACVLAVYAAIWAESVAESSRTVNNRTRYLLSVFLGGGLLTLALLALDFVFALENGQSDSRSKYMTQAINKGPFLLTITTLGIYICQKYLEGIPTGGLAGNHHEDHELQVLRTV